jgi:hypothetical protein
MSISAMFGRDFLLQIYREFTGRSAFYKIRAIIVHCTRPDFRRPVTAPGRTSTALDGIRFSWSNALADNSLRFGAPCIKGSDKRPAWCSRSGFSSRMESSFGRHSGHRSSSSVLWNIYFSPVSAALTSDARKIKSQIKVYATNWKIVSQRMLGK